MLRKSPKLTPAALAARRANALKSTGPRTDRGKAWSSLNALRDGRRAQDLRAKIARTGDRQALLLFDWFHVNLMNRFCSCRQPDWSYTMREAERVWCFMTGRALRPRLDTSGQRGAPEGGCRTYRYGGGLVCPRDLVITCKHGRGIRFRNPTPSRRNHVRDSWVPTVEFFDVPPRLPRAKRLSRRRLKESLSAAVAAATVPGAGSQAPVTVPSPAAVLGSEGFGRGSPANLECALESESCLEGFPGGAAATLERPASAARNSFPASDFDAWNSLEEFEESAPANLESLLGSLICLEPSAADSLEGIRAMLDTWRIPLQRELAAAVHMEPISRENEIQNTSPTTSHDRAHG